MNFFQVSVREDFASYLPTKVAGEIEDERYIPPIRGKEIELHEYFGEPPRKPGRRGDLHKSANAFFANSRAIAVVTDGCRGKLIAFDTLLEGRESEAFVQFWVTNFVDCLDEQKTVAGPPGIYSGKIGVIKKMAIDESRWDGSDLFVLPQDPSSTIVCTTTFIEKWRAAKLKGAMFSRSRFDPDPIRC